MYRKTGYFRSGGEENGVKRHKMFEKNLDICGKSVIITLVPAGVAHLVERHLAKVEVASSSLVFRSR